jgi:hypothetical protein
MTNETQKRTYEEEKQAKNYEEDIAWAGLLGFSLGEYLQIKNRNYNANQLASLSDREIVVIGRKDLSRITEDERAEICGRGQRFLQGMILNYSRQYGSKLKGK